MKSIKRENFIAEIYFNNHKYTPKNIRDYIESIRQIKLINPKDREVLIQESLKKLDSLMLKYRIRPDDPLQEEDTSTSPVGKELAGLVLLHCNRTIKLIDDGKEQDIVFLGIK